MVDTYLNMIIFPSFTLRLPLPSSNTHLSFSLKTLNQLHL